MRNIEKPNVFNTLATCVNANGKIYLSDRRYKALYSIDSLNGDNTFLGKFPGEDMHTGCCICGDDILFFSEQNNVDTIDVYSITTNKFSQIKIAKANNRPLNNRFSSIVTLRNYIYAMPCVSDTFLRIDKDTMDIKTLVLPSNMIDDDIIFINSIATEDQIFTCERNKPAVYCLTSDNSLECICKEKASGELYQKVIEYKGTLYLIPRKIGGTWYEIEKSSGRSKKFHLGINNSDDYYAYNILDNHIWAMPFSSRYAYSVDLDSLEVSETEICWSDERNLGYWGAVSMQDSLLFYTAEGNAPFLKVNKNGGWIEIGAIRNAMDLEVLFSIMGVN